MFRPFIEIKGYISAQFVSKINIEIGALHLMSSIDISRQTVIIIVKLWVCRKAL